MDSPSTSSKFDVTQRDISSTKTTKRQRLPKKSPAAKKLKSSPLDPFDVANLCGDVQSFIQHHFTLKDLLAMSEVCKRWNEGFKSEIVERSKLKLTIELRKAKHLETAGRKYKSVVMEVKTGFKFQALAPIADTIESMKLVIYQGGNAAMEFKNLKTLHLDVKSSRNFSWIAKLKVKRLEVLKITSSCCHDYPHNKVKCVFCRQMDKRIEWLPGQVDLVEFLCGLKKLKRLDMSECDDGFLWQKYTTPYYEYQEEFKLESLMCKEPELFYGESYWSLKSLTVTTNELSAHLISDLRELESLEIEDCLVKRYESSYKPHQNLKNLSLKFDVHGRLNLPDLFKNVKEFLALVPNVQTLFITKLTRDLMGFIAGTNLKMKEVKFSEIEGGTVEEYERMRGTQEEINCDIKLVHDI